MSSSALEIEAAVRVLVQAGAVFSLPQESGALSLEHAAARLDVDARWIRAHLDEFPGWYRLPAGTSCGRNVGELRIPVKDLERFEDNRRKARVAA